MRHMVNFIQRLVFIIAPSAIRLEPYVEYRIPVSQLRIPNPTALRRDWAYPAPECINDPLILSITLEKDRSITVTGGTNMRRI
ncbi:MAG: hypothetical protein N2248_00220 [candidate division WOR-3 bacterium]|uniref:Uncharacterized protein n=1 Tax=candidate division WOR-3 bacterium TaxID=2052148 RepID=A0A7C3EGF1_UNCW3|nr:hypothetical protein [candidate division WOR-3 bacterium]